MRLLETRTCVLHHFNDGEAIPSYAVLSHCWADDEVLFPDLVSLNGAQKSQGGAKVLQACYVASNDLGLDWIWIDTCCIDQSSKAELSEAIDSMDRWYQTAQVCIVWLSDLESRARSVSQLDADLHQCKWFSRGWTLQELIAPPHVLFYDSRWKQIGSKATLPPQLTQADCIDPDVLGDPDDLRRYSIGVPILWAAQGNTRREEHVAYCLFGLFGVSLPISYGEEGRACIRLQDQIMKQYRDSSLFAWRTHDVEHLQGRLAHSPAEFSHFALPGSFRALDFQWENVSRNYRRVTSSEPDMLHKLGQDIIFPATFKEGDDRDTPRLGTQLREHQDRYTRFFPRSISLTLLGGDPRQQANEEIIVVPDLETNGAAKIAAEYLRRDNETAYLPPIGPQSSSEHSKAEQTAQWKLEERGPHSEDPKDGHGTYEDSNDNEQELYPSMTLGNTAHPSLPSQIVNEKVACGKYSANSFQVNSLTTHQFLLTF
jgi:hypothetical protein